MPKTKIINSAGITAAIGLASLPVFLSIAPIFNSSDASAEGVTGSGAMALSVTPALAITAQNVSISASPAASNTFITATSTVNVKNTGAKAGYRLMMSSSNSGNLKNGSNEISTISSYSKTGLEMKNDSASSWGYTMQVVKGTNAAPAVNNGADYNNTYFPIPVSSTKWDDTANSTTSTYAYLKNTTGYTDQANGDDIAVGYGFSISPGTTAGTYTDTITYTAVANKDDHTLFDLTTMQDLAKYPWACENTPTPNYTASVSMTSLEANAEKVPEKNLIDARDNNSYRIRKLADGKCWMTADLKIAGKTLTPVDTNVDTNYNLPNNPSLEESIPKAPFGTNSSEAIVFQYNSVAYYTFAAATAGTNPSSGDATQDICPKGWRLPRKTEFNGLSSVYDPLMGGYAAWGGSKAPFSGNKLGFFHGSDMGSSYGNGFLWSSLASGVDRAYYVVLNEYYFGTETSSAYKYDGLNIRCVSKT